MSWDLTESQKGFWSTYFSMRFTTHLSCGRSRTLTGLTGGQPACHPHTSQRRHFQNCLITLFCRVTYKPPVTLTYH